ncbi:MAG: HAD-IA family hydrolase [Anaerolineales bacterium]|nr:HAD-IA family hydrolase [Anaerolineales bacterium]
MSLNISKIRALCFDVDGTLSDTDDLYVEKVIRFFPRLLIRDPQRAARRFVMWIESPGNALLGFADTLGVDDEMVAIISWMSRRKRKAWKKYLLVPGVDEMLARLKGHYPMAVVSARDENGTMAFLDHFGLTQYFDVIITGLSAEHTKPYPDPVLLAAQKMGVPPEFCLMIGDTTVDIRAGKSAGAQTVGVLCGFGEEAELKKFGANEILNATPKLADILLSGK